MLPYDSFLIDGPWLLSIGWVSAKLIKKFAKTDEGTKRATTFLKIATLLFFYITSVSLYFNLEWTRWIWEMCGAESGRDWMINSGVFNFDHENVSTKGHVMAALIFLTYPMWLEMGVRLGGRGGKCECESCE